MNQERTMQFILDNLAAVTVSQQRSERQIKGMQTILKTGMKMMVKLQQGQRELQAGHKELQAELKQLAAVQKRTDERFERWLGSKRNGGNGSH